LREYLLLIIGTVLFSAILTAILPEGKSAGMIKAITRMACTLTIISPMLQFFQSGTLGVANFEKTDDIFSQTVIDVESAYIHYYSELRIRETENALELEIAKKQGISSEVSIQWTEQNEGIYIKKICVKTLEKQDEEALRIMWEYLTKNYCSEVLIE